MHLWVGFCPKGKLNGDIKLELEQPVMLLTLDQTRVTSVMVHFLPPLLLL